MDRDFFFNAGMQPAWKLMTLMPEQSAADGVCRPNWEKAEQYSRFESALSSMVSSPVSNSTVSTDIGAVRELIGKLGSIRNGGGDVSQAAMTAAAPPHSSCYTTPINSSPPRLSLPIMDRFVDESIRNLMPLNPTLPSLEADPGFAERAAKFSCFGSRSFNGRNSQLGLNTNNPEYQFGSSVSPVTGNGKFHRVSSSPVLKIDRSPVGFEDGKNSDESNMKTTSCLDKKFSRFSSSAANSNEESSVSEQIPSGEVGLKNSNSRKRKGGSSKAIGATTAPAKEEEGNDEKRLKKAEEENTKAAEAPKDYIHVRARRGQATDSHSLAERVRREKISERMKLLQNLVPNCNKVTGKALMLDEIINYVQSLQKQVEFLSMKLATVNPCLDFDSNMGQQTHPNQSGFYEQTPQVLFNGSAPITQSVQEFTEPFPQFPGFGQDELQSIVQMGFGENLDMDTPFFHAIPDQASNMKMEL